MPLLSNYPGFETTRTASDAMTFRGGRMYCQHCEEEVCLVDDDADLAGLVNLADQHLNHCSTYTGRCWGQIPWPSDDDAPAPVRATVSIDAGDSYSLTHGGFPEMVYGLEPGEVLHADEFTHGEAWQIVRNLAVDDPGAVATVHAGFIHASDDHPMSQTYLGVSPLANEPGCDIPPKFAAVTITAVVDLEEKTALSEQLLIRYLQNEGMDNPLGRLQGRLATRQEERVV